MHVELHYSALMCQEQYLTGVNIWVSSMVSKVLLTIKSCHV